MIKNSKRTDIPAGGCAGNSVRAGICQVVENHRSLGEHTPLNRSVFVTRTH